MNEHVIAICRDNVYGFARMYIIGWYTERERVIYEQVLYIFKAAF